MDYISNSLSIHVIFTTYWGRDFEKSGLKVGGRCRHCRQVAIHHRAPLEIVVEEVGHHQRRFRHYFQKVSLCNLVVGAVALALKGGTALDLRLQRRQPLRVQLFEVGIIQQVVDVHLLVARPRCCCSLAVQKLLRGRGVGWDEMGESRRRARGSEVVGCASV
jgi:hypothetical protein